MGCLLKKLQRIKNPDEICGSPPLLTSLSSLSSSSSSSASSPLARRGYLPVRVGDDSTKYLIKASLLNHPLFAALLQSSAEKYGYSQEGVLRIDSDTHTFETLAFSLSSSSSKCKGQA